MKPYLGNRIGLAVTGTVLAGAGLYGFLRGQEQVSGRPGAEPILDPGLPARLAEDPWAGWLVALVLVVLTLVAVWWLLRSWAGDGGAGAAGRGPRCSRSPSKKSKG
nr:hypothetical protein GCM10020093_098640 [Planobispora longispora]